jgi:anthranilate phosphoribosyltransferase
MPGQREDDLWMSFAQALLEAHADPSRPFFARVQERLRRLSAASGEARSDLLDAAVEALLAGETLRDEDAEALFTEMLTGDVADDQIGSFLVLLQPDRVPPQTIAAFARAMRSHASPVHPHLKPGEVLGDTCGTGSDTLGTFNVSTTIMFMLAAQGMKIAKHGNRAITSRCGSADVLDELGVRIALGASEVEECIAQVGIGFMFAPIFHRSLRNLQNIRRTLASEMPPQLANRTVFNLLGPLANPASAPCQIIGVYERDLVPIVAEVLRYLDIARGLVVFGTCDGGGTVGLDELSTCGPSIVAEVRGDKISHYEITPEECGLPRVADPAAYRGGDAVENARILRAVLRGEETPERMDLALLNAGAGFYVADQVGSIKEGVDLAREMVRSGAAAKKLDEFIEATRNLG